MIRIILLGLCALLVLAGCASPSAPASTPPAPTVVVTLSGAFAHPTAPIGRARATPAMSDVLRATLPAPAVLTPTATVTPSAALVLLPTVTPAPADVHALPATYRATGTFASTTTFADGTRQRQEGNFAITHVQAAHAYGADEAYELTTVVDGGPADTVAVFQIGDYAAVRYADEWMVIARDVDSGLVKAVQPITDLARSFAQVRAQAQDLGVEAVNGTAARHYRVEDAATLTALLARPIFQPSGQVTAVQFDAWITEPEGMVQRYAFAMDVTGSQVLNANLEMVSADQQVLWSFEIVETGSDITLTWPEDAPAPGVLEVPGFAPEEFPMPPDTEVVTTYVGLPELVSASSVDAVSAFYHDQLLALGWSVERDVGLLRASKEGVTFQLLITADEATGGSKITILPAE
jgi:hypothetical protein